MSSPKSVRLACPKCAGGELRRLNRVGFLERRVLNSLGFFPWECVLCRKKLFRRNDGHAAIVERADQTVSGQNSAA